MKKRGGRWEDAAGGGNSNNPQTTYIFCRASLTMEGRWCEVPRAT